MIKRTFDCLTALMLLMVLSPVLVIVALVVRISLGSPVFFRQPRPGLGGKVFEIIKFRTMLDKYDSMGNPLSDEERVTVVSRVVREWSLDELPQLFNVINGDMSLVGPRPLIVEYLAFYNAEQARRHEVLPGITGWAQVNGRNAITWEEKFALDVWYVDHQSFWLDLKILWRTLVKVLWRAGIDRPGGDKKTVGSEYFRGSGHPGNT